ncbi:DUF1028 domain-containing protein [Saccharospirillum salsuginis]|uniref:DUF1028 domain-containing protein n=1 Tax=Saccharospirillum salsuginis TaxID=418750 RepID=A0A918KR32_9GAMM|nr:DUF1028 domain-containing protein [Saccharospirillum salsuginis]GGX72723.1 hypothetical protein GCM10007392_45050 [Saccharospirillum salsuginis]
MTYSIIAKDRHTGALGVATATGSVAVGGFVPHVRFQTGAIATQGAFTNWMYGEQGLALLSSGMSAEAVKDRLIQLDQGRNERQLIVLDQQGGTAAHTGSSNLSEKRHFCGDHFAVAGNMLRSEQIVEVMKEAFEARPQAPLHERLLAAMSAGEAYGGDYRGTHSAALKVQYRDRPPVDLRVDWAESNCIDQLWVLYEKTQSHAFQAFLAGVPTFDEPTRTGPVSDEEVK